MKTRKDLLENRCTHLEYYSQLFDENFENMVVSLIGKKKILDSTDLHFNDISLFFWQKIIPPSGTGEKLKKLGDYLTLSGIVCIAKSAAKNWKQKNIINKSK